MPMLDRQCTYPLLSRIVSEDQSIAREHALDLSFLLCGHVGASKWGMRKGRRKMSLMIDVVVLMLLSGQRVKDRARKGVVCMFLTDARVMKGDRAKF